MKRIMFVVTLCFVQAIVFAGSQNRIFESITGEDLSIEMLISLSDTAEYTGWYEDGLRHIYVANGSLMYQRNGTPMPVEMMVVEGDVKELYSFNVPAGAMTPPGGLPKLRFERDEANKVKGFTFVFDDGKEQYVKKDK